MNFDVFIFELVFVLMGGWLMGIFEPKVTSYPWGLRWFKFTLLVVIVVLLLIISKLFFTLVAIACPIFWSVTELNLAVLWLLGPRIGGFKVVWVSIILVFVSVIAVVLKGTGTGTGAWGMNVLEGAPKDVKLPPTCGILLDYHAFLLDALKFPFMNWLSLFITGVFIKLGGLLLFMGIKRPLSVGDHTLELVGLDLGAKQHHLQQ